jgi:hypothetical protein
MSLEQNISPSRRRFLGNGLKLAVLAGILLPFQKALSTGTAALRTTGKRLYSFLLIDKLVLNTKSKVVHLPTRKIFKKYPNIKSQKVIGFNEWENQVKPPFRFNKEKSGIILEMLVLQKLNEGINEKTLTDAYRILSMAFTPVYKNKGGIIFNKYNFRLHHLLLKIIALNETITNEQKWAKFQSATGSINYNEKDKKPLSKYMNWIKTKAEFDKKVSYILQNKQTYISRLAKRANRYKL